MSMHKLKLEQRGWVNYKRQQPYNSVGCLGEMGEELVQPMKQTLIKLIHFLVQHVGQKC